MAETVPMADVPMKAAEEKGLIISPNANPMEIQHTRQEIIALALQQKADPSVLSKLMDLQERWEANEAKKAYTKSMAAFKQECPPVIPKDSSVDFSTAKGRTHYAFVSLGSLVDKITSLLGKFGLSAAWQTKQDEGWVTVSCKITHEKGHSEQVTLSAPPDDSGNKNKIQQIGSTVTYLERYTLFAALGLASGDPDDDGVGAGPRPGVDAPAPEVPPKQPPAPQEQPAAPERKKGCISDKQQKRLFAIAKSDPSWENDDIKKLLSVYGYEHTKDVPKGKGGDYDKICACLEMDTEAGLAKAYEEKL
jgi:hypothetical protein